MASAGRGQETAEELWAGEGLGMADIGAGVPLLVVSAAAFALNAGVLEVAIRTRLVAAPGRDSIRSGWIARVSTDCGRAAAFFSFETDKSRPPFLEALRDK